MEKKPNISSFTIIVSFLCLSLVGLALVPLLPVKLSPSQAMPSLSINFGMSNASARVVEMEVTSKLEAMLARVKGIRGIYSTSGNGWGTVSLNFDKHTNIDVARFEVSTIIRQAWPQLPDNVSYPQVSVSRSDDKSLKPFMTYTLNAATTPIIIQRYAENQIKTRLSQIPGIYKVDVSGATPMEWRLVYDNQLLVQLGITANQIREAVQQHYLRESLGLCQIEKNGEEQWIRLALVSESEKNEFVASKIQVTSLDGKLITLDKLVTVTRMEQAPQSYYRINGLNSIYIAVTAEETANQLQLNTVVKEQMKQIEAALPNGYELHNNYDATEYIHDELNKVYLRTGLTILILLLFVLAITLSPRYLLLIVLSLVINILTAAIFYYLLKLEMQFYSLAGITISLSLIIDNTIIMTDHLLHRGNKKAFLSMLAATLTTMGALVIIFFLDEKIKLNLQDFAAVIIVNLGVSLFVALFLVPALADKLNLKDHIFKIRRKKRPGKRKRFSRKRLVIYFSRAYVKIILFLRRWRWATCILLILAFGLPVFKMPEKLDGESFKAVWYNKIFNTSTYREKVAPIVNKALGGTLRLFIEKVYNGSYFTRSEELVLTVYATLPNGTTVEQMNNLIQRMESFLSEYKDIRQFQTSINSARRASISIYFPKEVQKSGFPYELKSKIISKAIELGGGSWSVYGLEDQGFSNDVRETTGSYGVEMYGYNYDELFAWAETLKKQLLTNRRIKEVLINSEYSYYKDDYREFYFDLDKQRMIEENISPYQLFATVQPAFSRDQNVGSVLIDNELEYIKLSSLQSRIDDFWSMDNMPYTAQNKSFKLSDLAGVEKGQMPQSVVRANQQYKLYLQYEYIGSSQMGQKVLEKTVKEVNEILPVGYRAEVMNRGWWWGSDNSKQYLLLLLVITIIFFTTSILFNSLRQPFAIIFVIPISYIGVFLTFYWFKLNFDQGGFASFVLLCGITVNASIYILNEFNSIRRRYPNLTPVKAYVKAWNSKIVPIFLTIVSTILGFIPFMIGAEKEAFWFPLASGTIGGLIMSVIGIFFYLPLFIKFSSKKKNKMKKKALNT